MGLSVAFLVATVIALAAMAGFAYQPKPIAVAGSDVYSATSSSHAPRGVQLQRQNDDEPDTTEMVLLTLAISAGAGVLALIGYVIRKRVGFFPHRPPPRDSNPLEDHH